MANSQRIVNPFSTTPESDWIHIQHSGSAGDTESRKKLGSSSGSSRRSSPPRKLPPRGTTTLTATTNAMDIPPHRSTSLLSESMMVPDKPKKSAPPIPRKPVNLSTTRTPSSGLSPVATQSTSFPTQRKIKEEDEYRPPLPTRRPTADDKQQDQMMPRRLGNTATPIRSGTATFQKSLGGPPPPPPAPRGTTGPSRTFSPTGLMDTDAEKDMPSWEPLRPQK